MMRREAIKRESERRVSLSHLPIPLAPFGAAPSQSAYERNETKRTIGVLLLAQQTRGRFHSNSVPSQLVSLSLQSVRAGPTVSYVPRPSQECASAVTDRVVTQLRINPPTCDCHRHGDDDSCSVLGRARVGEYCRLIDPVPTRRAANLIALDRILIARRGRRL